MKRIRWNQTSVLRKLRELYRSGKALSYSSLSRTDQSLVSAAAYHFGSFRTAVEKAGIDYSLVSRRPRWTRLKIIQLIKLAKRNGEALHWSAVTGRRDELGKAAFASLQKKLFGSWQRALTASGLDGDEISRYRRWDPESIIFELRQIHANGEPLNSGAIQSSDPGLHAAAVRKFGSYDAALRKAKIEPASVRRRRRWKKQDVIDALKAFLKVHRRFNDFDLRQKDPALYGTVLRRFGSVAKAKTFLTNSKSDKKAT